jgi:hypothetical protein
MIYGSVVNVGSTIWSTNSNARNAGTAAMIGTIHDVEAAVAGENDPRVERINMLSTRKSFELRVLDWPGGWVDEFLRRRYRS